MANQIHHTLRFCLKIIPQEFGVYYDLCTITRQNAVFVINNLLLSEQVIRHIRTINSVTKYYKLSLSEKKICIVTYLVFKKNISKNNFNITYFLQYIILFKKKTTYIWKSNKLQYYFQIKHHICRICHFIIFAFQIMHFFFQNLFRKSKQFTKILTSKLINLQKKYDKTLFLYIIFTSKDTMMKYRKYFNKIININKRALILRLSTPKFLLNILHPWTTTPPSRWGSHRW